MFAEERLRQLGMSDPSSRSYKAGDLSDPEQQLRYHLQQLEASQASSGRKPSNMVRAIHSFIIQSVSNPLEKARTAVLLGTKMSIWWAGREWENEIFKPKEWPHLATKCWGFSEILVQDCLWWRSLNLYFYPKRWGMRASWLAVPFLCKFSIL